MLFACLFMVFACVLYTLFVAALTVAVLLRIDVVRDMYTLQPADDGSAPPAGQTASPSFPQNTNEQILLVLDACIYILGLPYLIWNAWFHNRLRIRDLDVNEDMHISWSEFTMWIFKNLNALNSGCVAALLIATAILRYLCQPEAGFGLLLSRDKIDYDTLKQELDVLAVAAVIGWCNVLMQWLPFRGMGHLLISMARMLSNSILKWLSIYIIILVGFSLAATVMTLKNKNEEDNVCAEQVPLGWIDMLQFFVWVSIGEADPGSVLVESRNQTLMTILFLCFVVTSTWMLMNLLISLMTATFQKDIEKGKQRWWLEYASLVLRYETLLSDKQKMKYRSGIFTEKNLHADKKDCPDHSDVEYYQVGCSVLHAVCCSVLQCSVSVAVCCSVLQSRI